MCGLYFKNCLQRLHVPVMAREVVEGLQIEPKGTYIDMTFGAGGHTKALLETDSTIRIVTMDRDPVSHKLAKSLQEEVKHQVIPLKGKFSNLPALLDEIGIFPGSVNGFIFDLGCSSMQLDQAERGFSHTKPGPLDMRMDNSEDSLTAADIVAYCEEDYLAKILKAYGEERASKKIARAIVESRHMLGKLKLTTELSALVAEVLGYKYGLDMLARPAHVATRTFQALRMFVNNEINELSCGMELAYYYLKAGGRIATLSFHSLEDRLIKQHLTGPQGCISSSSPHVASQWRSPTTFHDEESMKMVMKRRWKQLHKHVQLPNDDEVAQNPRSRSAKLRIAEKCD